MNGRRPQMLSVAMSTLALLALMVGPAMAETPSTTAYNFSSHPMISGTVARVNDHQMIVDTEQGEQVTDGHEFLQVLLTQADAEVTLDLGNNADDVHRVQAKVLAEVLGVVEVVELLADVVLDKVNQGLANLIAIGHGTPSCQWRDHGRAPSVRSAFSRKP